MGFDSIPGHERVKNILSSAIKRQRLAHAYLFYGHDGVGKDAMAIELAKMLLCTGEQKACDTCKHCSAINRGEHESVFPVLPAPSRPKTVDETRYYDIIIERTVNWFEQPYRPVVFLPDLTTRPLISIDQIRAMKKWVRLKSTNAAFRIFIVSNADMMNSEAANSLLKLLEEPPSETMLILTTSFPNRLPQTIVSRCQQIRFDPLREEEIGAALSARFEVDPKKAAFLARMSGGSLKRALDFLDETFEEKRNLAVAFLEASLSKKIDQRIAGSRLLLKNSEKTAVTEILQLLQIWLRDLHFLQNQVTENLMNIDRMDSLNRFHEKWPVLNIESGLFAVEGAIDYSQKNVYLPLVIFSLAGKLNKCI